MGRVDKLIHCGGMRRVDKLSRRRCGKSGQADTRRHGERVMHEVVEKVDELIHYGGVGRVDELSRR